MPSGDLDGFDSENAACSARAVFTGHHSVAGAEDVGRACRRPFAERRDLLGHAPELPSETSGRVTGDARIAVVIEDLDRARLRPGHASVLVPNGRFGRVEPGPDLDMLGIEAETWYGHQGA